jgi:lipopolysaccharide transport system permease protein
MTQGASQQQVAEAPPRPAPDDGEVADAPVTIIEPGRHGLLAELREVFRYRELLYFLIWRDVKVRYKQTILGALWAILKPFASMVVFSIFFGRLAKMPSDGVPYPIFIYAALLPWQFFEGALTRSSGSLVGSANLITKVYFPRVIIPAAGALAGVVDFFFAALVMFGLMAYYQFSPHWGLLAVPLLLLLAWALAVGVGLCLSAVNVRFRDIGYIVPFFVQMWMFVTPVVYPLSLAPGKYRPFMIANPVTGVIEGFRWAFLGRPFPGTALLYSTGVAIILLLVAQSYFRRVERSFADVV